MLLIRKNFYATMKKTKIKGEFFMIGLGNWACKVNSMFFSGEVKFTISDNDGEYGFDFLTSSR